MLLVGGLCRCLELPKAGNGSLSFVLASDLDRVAAAQGFRGCGSDRGPP